MTREEVELKLRRYFELKQILDRRDAQIRSKKNEIEDIKSAFADDELEAEGIRTWLLEQHQSGDEYVIEEYDTAKVEVKVLPKPQYDNRNPSLVAWFIDHKPEAVVTEVNKTQANKVVLALADAGLELPPNAQVNKVPTLYVTERKET